MSVPALIDPPVPADTDCRRMPFMPVDVVTVLESELIALSSGDEFKAAFTLWCKSWIQVPAGSLPSDDRILAKMVSVSVSQWAEIRDMALRGWIKCSDGRLYHPLIAEKVLVASKRSRAAKAKADARWGAKPSPGIVTPMLQHAQEEAPAMQVEREKESKKVPKKPPTDSDPSPPIVGAAPSAPPAKARKNGTRIPWDWTASPKDIAYAEAEGFPPEAIRRIEDAFFDFWKAKAGAGGTKLDWAATWRTWVRTEADRKGGRHGPGSSTAGSAPLSRGLQNRQDRVGRMQRGAVAALDRERRNQGGD